MMTETTELSPEPSPSVFSMLVSIVDKPRSTFGHLTANPQKKWILPLILSVIVLIASVLGSLSYSVELAESSTRQQLSQAGMSESEMEQAFEQTATFRSPAFIGGVGIVVGSVGVVVVWLASAALLYFVSLVAGGELNFNQMFVVVAWSSLPITLRTLIQTIIGAVTGRVTFYPGLAALQTSGDPLADSANVTLTLLSFVDPFWIWSIVLLVIGISVAAKFSWLKSSLIALLYAAVSIGIAVARAILVGRA